MKDTILKILSIIFFIGILCYFDNPNIGILSILAFHITMYYKNKRNFEVVLVPISLFVWYTIAICESNEIFFLALFVLIGSISNSIDKIKEEVRNETIKKMNEKN